MSETLKFGNGQWAVKEGSALAYNDENGNYKPLPFNFERSTGATRVNKQGLIEVVTNNEPRIDFLNDSKGALLLEPSRSNLITYSEAFDNSYWTKSEASVTSGFISPDGATNSFKLVENTNNSAHIIFASPSITLGNNIFSVFAKASERRVLGIEFPTNGILVSFDLIDGVFVNSQANPDGFSITPYANGWYRIDIQEDLTSTSAVSLSLRDDNGNRIYQGDGTSGIYIWGGQLEVGSYATSYIPTQGSIGTRVAEVCSQTLPSGIINSSEGVLYAEIANDLLTGGDGYISLSDGNALNRATLRFTSATNNLACQYVIGGVNQTSMDNVLTDRTALNKIAFKFKENDFAVWVNGVELSTDLNGSVLSSGTLNKLSNDNGAGVANFYGKVKDLRVYNKALTDQELQALTKI